MHIQTDKTHTQILIQTHTHNKHTHEPTRSYGRYASKCFNCEICTSRHILSCHVMSSHVDHTSTIYRALPHPPLLWSGLVWSGLVCIMEQTVIPPPQFNYNCPLARHEFCSAPQNLVASDHIKESHLISSYYIPTYLISFHYPRHLTSPHIICLLYLTPSHCTLFRFISFHFNQFFETDSTLLDCPSSG